MAKKTTTPKTKKVSAKNVPKKPSHADFLVVGIGASAGGIQALQEFFAAMPPTSGMAFVVILHLSPEHESSLEEIIQTRTQMPVVTVAETQKVEPNHVYVIPPKRQLEMADGVIRSTEQQTGERGVRAAIDIFFRTLARVYAKNAVCVVLSGTGTDGTIGLKAIKEANGFAVVQDPADAEYDSMPRSAIATQLVDRVLPVRLIPEKLLQFRESSERLHLTNDDGEDSDTRVAKEIRADKSLREILTVLRLRTGHDFSNYKTPTLIRRIARQLQINNLEDIPAYLDFLRETPDEIQSLLKNLLINVTNFFRDKEEWEFFEREIVPNLFTGKKGTDTVRVWSCGCASGEEAYSLGIILCEYASRLADPPKIQIFATDVDTEAIAEAREHLYPQSIEVDVSPERLKRFFVWEGKYYRVKKELREMILFAPHNVLRDPPFSRLDLVTCRNLLIYLNRETQQRVLEIFHFALAPHGSLFLGNSESAESVPALFSPLDKSSRIYERRPHAFSHVPVPPRMPVEGRWDAGIREFTAKSSERALALGEVHFKLLESLAPPSVLVDEEFEIQYLSESAGRFLRLKGGEPSSNLLKLVNEDLLPDLRAALFNTRREKKSVEFLNVHAVIDGIETTVNIIVRPVEIGTRPDGYRLVLFDEQNNPSKQDVDRHNGDKIDSPAIETVKSAALDSVISQLHEELERTKENLRATIEQHEITVEEHKASSEELQAINEELRSAGEELETGKEELRSVNEELSTVKAELKKKILESARINSDLQNLMASTEIATLFLDRNLRIKRYTPPVVDIFNVTPPDIGRPLEHFTNNLEYEHLTEDAREVLRSLTPVEREIGNKNKRTYLARILPYRTLDDRIEGVVLNFLDITDRKLVERALNRSEGRLRTILESAKDYAIFTLDTERRVTVWNAGAEAIFGYTEEEMLGRSGDIIFTPEEIKRKVPERETEIALSKGRAANERWHIRRDNSRFWGSGLTMPLRDDDEKVIGFVKIMRDLTEQKKLEDTKFFLAAVIESSADSVVTVNFDGEITSWNKSAEALYGYTAKEAVGKPLTMLTLPGDLQEILKNIESIKYNRKVKIFDTVRIHKDGHEMQLEIMLSPVKNSHGKVIGVSTVARDITRRKISEEALQASQERYRAVVESATDYAIFTLDENNKISSWNKGAEYIFGWRETEILGSDVAILFTPEDREKGEHLREKETALRTGRAEDERWHMRKDSSLFFASGLLMTLNGGSGFVKICRDQTDKVMAESLQREKEMLAQFVSTQEDERRRIARDIHDHVGQQMTVLRLKLEALKEICDDDEICSEIEKVSEITERLDREIDFLAWELRPATLDDLGLRHSLENFVAEWSRHTGIPAEFHATGLRRSRFAFATETNLYRIAQEALNNVFKHAKPARVAVLLEKHGATLSLIVEDDGVGFNPKDKRNRSRGLGLIGMTERARICGGTLEIESAKGKGTTVFARVPAGK